MSAEHPAAQGRRVAINPDPLEAVKRRDDVTAIAALRGRSREDKLRVWLALGGTEADFPEAREEVCAMQNIKVCRYEHPDAGYLGWIEPEDASWIAFVRDDHVPEVYLDRDPETGAAAPHAPSAACTCDPEAYDLGHEGQRRYFPDRGCSVHGDPEWIASKTVPGEDESPSLDGGRERRNGPKVAGGSDSAARSRPCES